MTQANTPTTKVIKRYANRKLYDTETSKYTTLKAVAAAVAAGQSVQVIDKETKEDITGSTLVMALVETEKDLGGQTEALVDIFKAGGLAKYVAGMNRVIDDSLPPQSVGGRPESN
jgi:polyhydroxyalkanoate synthesis repressor PhaR